MTERKAQDHPAATDTPEDRGPGLNEGAPVANQESTIRDAKVGDEKPDETSIAQVEEIKE